MQPGSSNMTTPSYPEGGSIGKTSKMNTIAFLQMNNTTCFGVKMNCF